ncbi:4-hydroxy-3-methylbut-2-enyl diphosphate reductase [Thermovibrio ammonificans]|jgi:4-hydroxy-3-methylbut-2-enyl diphosphate reductase|uniref:4-hydroxy-3-methylbut-2-enyl diphosphate reductase n=1 Tax=Thermovibrio ammonificans (strain DSM 15698 / JCM 12110 / HB-1) TaxID=648996 RepID=E8T5S2_THEA1|nr:4-hydroxy-3-methylbut-2-enyl diphosphate reductase [Thermovibrio ammonificans]ADU97648.1 hydroxymethylbutenyl pyrophosphate reductase [Thermovibrio ammonificans HB-1]
MEIKVAKSAGFCWGVKRAVNMAVEALEKDGRAYCLGELIHNRREIERLRKLGMDFIEDMDAVKKGDTVVIRSHGVAPSVIEFLKGRGARVVDATCPFVKDVHEKAMKLEREGYPVLILGNPKHPEVIGIAGHLKEPIIASTVEEVEALPKMPRLGVVCQTTLNLNFFKEAISLLALKVKELKVYNTICSATSIRQRETRKLAGQVDVMLIIGGKNSSNTTKLYQISKSVNPRSYHVESKDEIDPAWFEGAKSVGITAGASTPAWVIDEVVQFVKDLGKGGVLSGRGVCQTAGGEL